MPDDTLHPALKFRPWPIGDPWVLVDTVLQQIEAGQHQQVMGIYLESVAATLQAHLRLVEGIRQVVVQKQG